MGAWAGAGDQKPERLAKVRLQPLRDAVVLLVGLLAVLTAAESPHHCEPEASGACHDLKSHPSNLARTPNSRSHSVRHALCFHQSVDLKNAHHMPHEHKAARTQ